MRPFDYLIARDAQEAVGLLLDNAEYLAGGTTLLDLTAAIASPPIRAISHSR
jgi:CO/xanthine dehydrogenase FAD-binding subunit